MAQGKDQKTKDQLKAPEGLYELFSVRRTNLVSFKPDKLPKLALAEDGSAQIRILHAVADVVEVCEYGPCDKVRFCFRMDHAVCQTLCLPSRFT